MYIPAALMAVAFLGFVEPANPGQYKVEFDVRDGLEATTHPSMHYTMLLDESRKAVFEAMSRVPSEHSTPPYVDVGTKIELTVHDSDGKITLDGSIELSSITGHVCLGLCMPLIGQRKVTFHTTVDLETPTVILDDPAAPATSAATRRIEAVVTKVN